MFDISFEWLNSNHFTKTEKVFVR